MERSREVRGMRGRWREARSQTMRGCVVPQALTCFGGQQPHLNQAAAAAFVRPILLAPLSGVGLGAAGVHVRVDAGAGGEGGGVPRNGLWGGRRGEAAGASRGRGGSGLAEKTSLAACPLATQRGSRRRRSSKRPWPALPPAGPERKAGPPPSPPPPSPPPPVFAGRTCMMSSGKETCTPGAPAGSEGSHTMRLRERGAGGGGGEGF